MKVVVKNLFYFWENREKTYSPGTVLEIEDAVRIDRLVRNDLAEPYTGEREADDVILLGDKSRSIRADFLSRLDENMIRIEGYDYPFRMNRFKLSQREYCGLLNITISEMKRRESLWDRQINEQFPYITRDYVFKDGMCQSLEGVKDVLRALQVLTGRHLRLPSINEWEFVASNGGKDYDLKSKDYNMHDVNLGEANELGVCDIVGNEGELCFVISSGVSAKNIFYVRKSSPAVESVEYDVTNYYTYNELTILGAGVRLVESDMQPCDMTERHPEIEERIESRLEISLDDYEELRRMWEH